MPIINSFLHKCKSQENGPAMMLIVTAYVISALLLILVSDLFYEVTTKAEQLPEIVGEVTEDEYHHEIINPYGMKVQEIEDSTELFAKSSVSADTYWLLGSAMSSEEYLQLLGKLEEVDIVNQEVKEETKTDKYSVTKEERAMLERIVEAEAGSEDMIGRILIANVIFNRIEDQEFPDTIKEVIFQKVSGSYQFSPIKDKRYWSVEVSSKTKEAVKRAIEGEDYSEGALYFMARKLATKKNIKWFDNNLTWLFQHGVHEFYKD